MITGFESSFWTSRLQARLDRRDHGEVSSSHARESASVWALAETFSRKLFLSSGSRILAERASRSARASRRTARAASASPLAWSASAWKRGEQLLARREGRAGAPVPRERLAGERDGLRRPPLPEPELGDQREVHGAHAGHQPARVPGRAVRRLRRREVAPEEMALDE
ncbi:hypothetical protein BE21_22655 [Sorangium cellulosum]|uniref:Uncharacterized protein n=1 Tax=Sorangium cellulosum TaxID=56 RepID=A0A150TVB5_SORCE|nr:hypothetical protein BE21_22655 [Sorangium cellulosum]